MLGVRTTEKPSQSSGVDFQSDGTIIGLSTSGRLINQDMFIYLPEEDKILVLFQLSNLKIKIYPLEMIFSLWHLTVMQIHMV